MWCNLYSKQKQAGQVNDQSIYSAKTEQYNQYSKQKQAGQVNEQSIYSEPKVCVV